MIFRRSMDGRVKPGNDGAGATMNNARPLAQIEGAIVLAGAGKMGGALLSGWLAGGLDASNVAVIEPYPSDDIKAIAAKGCRLNPAPANIGNVAALVIAL